MIVENGTKEEESSFSPPTSRLEKINAIDRMSNWFVMNTQGGGKVGGMREETQ